jgi:hypothetical protein
VVVESSSSLGVLLKELEEMEGCVKAELEAAVGTVIWVLVAGLLELGGEGEDTLCDAGSPIFGRK